uniref:arrestin 3b, retinal (X-arrestin) isoform X1 n=1 Tax=Oncorhynchus gorbuscha TaxID=8017 RepID=UPI001EAF0556|nr:arrestin 3b, retinal (X-arrestin) isoform X1 [Oncorhynchus gorbuscha]
MAKVYKKTSGNESIALYLGKRDFVDHVESVDIVDGVIKVDPAELEGRKVWVYLACAFRYGSDDLDVIGLSFRKDIWVKRIQIYPVVGTNPPNTPMQEALLKKCGDQGHPFTFTIDTNLPCSVGLQPAPEDAGKSCGVDYEVKAYIAKEADDPDEKISKKDTCRLIIRKIQFAPGKVGAGPKADISKNFMMSDKPVHLEASIEKELYFHGDPIPVNVKINNETTKVVKKIKITVEQTTEVLLYQSDKYSKTVLTEEFAEEIKGESTLEKTFTVIPLLSNNKEKRGLAVDGRLKDEDTNLASTTIIRPGMDKGMQGIMVSYKIKVNLLVSSGGLLGGLTASDVGVEVPLILMSPKPADVTDIKFE